MSRRSHLRLPGVGIWSRGGRRRTLLSQSREAVDQHLEIGGDSQLGIQLLVAQERGEFVEFRCRINEVAAIERAPRRLISSRHDAGQRALSNGAMERDEARWGVARGKD